MDSYLEIARKVLRRAGQPLSARQIMKAAYQLQIVPRDLFGRTQHKTLQARLSTDILKLRSQSDFYRTGPGRFSIRTTGKDRTSLARDRREYVAPLRAAQLGRFDVLAFPRSEVVSLGSGNPSRLSVSSLTSLSWRYAQMQDVRRDTRLLPFRFLVVIVDDDRVALCHRRPSADDDLGQQVALGVEGVVRREDRSLFSRDDAGLSDAAIRTLMQRLDLPQASLSVLEGVSRWSSPIALYEECGEPSGDDFMAMIAFRCTGVPEVVEAVESLATLGWVDFPIRINERGRFDRWSNRLACDASLLLAVCGSTIRV